MKMLSEIRVAKRFKLVHGVKDNEIFTFNLRKRNTYMIILGLGVSLSGQVTVIDKIRDEYYVNDAKSEKYKNIVEIGIWRMCHYIVSKQRYDDIEVLLSTYLEFLNNVIYHNDTPWDFQFFDSIIKYSSSSIFDPEWSLWNFIKFCSKKNTQTLLNICIELSICQHEEIKTIVDYFQAVIWKCPQVLTTRLKDFYKLNVALILSKEISCRSLPIRLEICEMFCQYVSDQWKEIRQIQKTFAKLGLHEVVFENHIVPYIECSTIQKDNFGNSFFHYFVEFLGSFYDEYENGEDNEYEHGEEEDIDIKRERCFRMISALMKHIPYESYLAEVTNDKDESAIELAKNKCLDLYYYFCCLMQQQPNLLDFGFTLKK